MSGKAAAPAKKKLTHIGQYEIGRTLGEGSFSKVKLATDVFSGKKFAIKIVDWSLVDDLDDQTECIEREIKIMKLLDHPNIVKLFDIISHRDDKQTFLVQEYISRGELFDYIVANGRIREPESRKFWRQLISAVEYCHAFLVVHRDLKPSNLLLDDAGNIKITDFGLSNTMTPGKLFTTWCGSLYYSAPEIVEEKQYVGPAVDVWSCGVILYALLNGRLPWSGKCLARDTPVLMHDGAFKLVQHVRVGDALMGDDATPRRVLSLARGAEPMARVALRGGGDAFTCNVSHVLSLKAPRYPQRRAHRLAVLVARRHADGTVAALRCAERAFASVAAAKAALARCADSKAALALLVGAADGDDVLLAGETIDIAVKDLLDRKRVDDRLRAELRAYRVGCLEFAHRPAAAVDAFVLAFLLGCGARCGRDGAIEFAAPQAAVAGRFATRVAASGSALTLDGCGLWRLCGGGSALAAAVARGSLDDAELRLGSVATRRALLDGALASQLLAQQRHNDALVRSVLFVARSLGCSVRRRGTTHVVSSSSATCVERFDVEVLPVDEYFGFAIDGNRRFVVGDGLIVTHNTDLEKIRQIVVADIAPADRDLSDGCLDLIYGCCTVDVKDRLTIPQIRNHPWTNETYNGPPPCHVPKTMPVAKVSEPVLQQLVFLGILDDSDEAHEQARNDIMENKQNQIVFAYHTLLGKPQLLVSASFLPRDKIKRAVSQARTDAAAAATAAAVSRLATNVAGPDDDDSSSESLDSIDAFNPPPPPPKTAAPDVMSPPPKAAASNAADLQDLSDILGELDNAAAAAAAAASPKPQAVAAPGSPTQAAKAKTEDARAAVDALMGDLDALSASVTAAAAAATTKPKPPPPSAASPPPPPPPSEPAPVSPVGDKKKKSSANGAAVAVETRRRSRTVSAGSKESQPAPPKIADVLRNRLGAAKPKPPTDASGAAPAPPPPAVVLSAPTSPQPPPPRTLASALAEDDVQTRQRSLSLGQRNAVQPTLTTSGTAIPNGDVSPPASPLATSATAVTVETRNRSSTWAANLFKRRSKKKEDMVDLQLAMAAEAAAAAAATAASSSAASTAQTSGGKPALTSSGKTANTTWDPSLFAKAKANSAAAEAAEGDEIRTVKGVFKCATTSTRPPQELVAAVERALNGVTTLKFKRKSQFLFRVADKKTKVRLEIEVVNVEKLDRMHGIRFARLQGDAFEYKKLAETVMGAIQT